MILIRIEGDEAKIVLWLRKEEKTLPFSYDLQREKEEGKGFTAEETESLLRLVYLLRQAAEENGGFDVKEDNDLLGGRSLSELLDQDEAGKELCLASSSLGEEEDEEDDWEQDWERNAPYYSSAEKKELS